MKVVGQVGMDETVMDVPALEEALEARYEARERVRAVAQGFREADTRAKALIEGHVPVGGIARVGRFRVERKPTTGRHVEFDTKAGVRVIVTVDSED